MPDSDATRCGNYEIVCQLAQGVYTNVFEARCTHPNLHGRMVTLKVLRQQCFGEQFLRAARLNASLQHSRIPSLYELGDAAGQAYMVREFVAGRNLRSRIEQATPSIAAATAIVADVSAALDYAHGRGFVHGMVHPRHVLVGTDGAASLIGLGEYPPWEPSILGNPRHLAPEQLSGGGGAIPASDVYALAETAYWLLAGRHPFEGLRVSDLLTINRSDHLRQQAAELRTCVPAAVANVLLRGLAPRPADRYATAGEFATTLISACR